MEQPKIFISYSREDMGLVRQIRDHVESVTGLRCWMDMNAVESSTKQFAKDIINNINNSDVFLYMLSEHSQQSEVVLRELDFATKKGKHVVIVNVDDCTITDEFQFLYGLTDTIRWSDVAQRRKLLGDLKRWVGASGPEQERLGDVGQDAERWTKEEQEEQDRRIREAERSKHNRRRKGKIEQKIAGEAAKRTKENAPGEPISETERRAKEGVQREASEEDDPKPKKKTLLWVIIGVVAVLIAVFLFLRWYIKPIPDPPQPSYRSIVVNCTPDSAKLFVNGQEKGFTPITVSQLLPGGYEIRLTKEGYIDYVDSIDVKVDSCLKIALQPKEEETFTVNGISFTMKLVEGGTFQMGAQKTNSSGQNYDSEVGYDEGPVHNVTLSSYYMGETEVTQALWKAVMGSNPSYFKGDDLPVERVKWNDCQEFIRKLNLLTGKNFRLPTEAEWEYAARGGNKSKGYRYAGGNTIDSVAVYNENSYYKGSTSPDFGTHRVKSKKANELGLYDMSGNVWEWCSDWYGSDYYSKSPSANPSGLSRGWHRVLRGGSWDYSLKCCRVSDRNYGNPDHGNNCDGFRLALAFEGQNEVDVVDETYDSDNDLTFDVNGTSFTMKFVEGGTFWMGAQKTYSSGQNYDSEANDNESPVHSVTLSSYYIGETEVTQALWKAVMGSNPSEFEGDDFPVEKVSWNDCQEFIRKLNQLTGKNFRLPTEAEWEYAARGGNKSKGYKYPGSNTIDSVAVYYENSYNKGQSSPDYGPHRVKSKKPNELGLYDMAGNVWEWCSDRYGSDYYSKSPSANPSGLSNGSYRVLRGGSWGIYARYSRVSNRYYHTPGIMYWHFGFRLTLTLQGKSARPI